MYTSPKILCSRQRDRMKAEEEAKERCRRMKRTSEVRPSFFFYYNKQLLYSYLTAVLLLQTS